jgi:Family of unknown function (DUF5691)
MKRPGEVALLGTARHTGDVPPTGTPVDPLLSVVAAESPEWRLLLAAGAEAVYRQAGQAPRTGIPLPAPAGTELRPPCSLRATVVLHDVLRDSPAVLPEALARLGAAGLRLAPTLLPEALSLRRPELRAALVPVLGERGMWLARQHPDWAWVLADAPEDVAERQRRWEEGSPAERLAALRRERAMQPDVARGWLEATWKQEKADARASLLSALEVGLGPADTALLESALEDRSQAVRAAAAGLLSRLPTSAFAQRQVERADALVSFTPPPPGVSGLWGAMKARLQGESPSGVLVVEPPASLPREWERDGIAPKPPQGLGERAHWLSQLLALVPPSHWEARLSATPAQLVRAAVASDWCLALALGWSRAAEAFEARTWAAPLWDLWQGLAERPAGVQGAAAAQYLHSLLSLMSAADAEERVLRVVEHVGVHAASLEALVRALPAPWSAAAAERYLRELGRRLGGAERTEWTWASTLAPAALALPSEAVPRAIALASAYEGAALPSGFARPVDTFLTTLRMRQRLLEEIAL